MCGPRTSTSPSSAKRSSTCGSGRPTVPMRRASGVFRQTTEVHSDKP